MNYKIYISGYIEETQQLLVSFSSDETSREAIDYQSMAFDIVPYGDVSPDEILKQISRLAPTICEDIKVQETYIDNSVKAQSLKNLVGKAYTYNINTGDADNPDPAISDLALVTDGMHTESEAI